MFKYFHLIAISVNKPGLLYMFLCRTWNTYYELSNAQLKLKSLEGLGRWYLFTGLLIFKWHYIQSEQGVQLVRGESIVTVYRYPDNFTEIP